MTIYTFLAQCSELWPGKELTAKQQVFYGEKLSQFTDIEVGKIFNWLTENSKFFPKIADIFEAARHCGFSDRPQEYHPHVWEPNDCSMCGGSGQLAVFFEQLFDLENGRRELSLKRVMQYQASEKTVTQHLDWTRYFFRCVCPRGDVKTLDKGWPKWNPMKPSRVELTLEPRV